MNLNLMESDTVPVRCSKIKMIVQLANADFEKALKKAPKMLGRLALPSNGERYGKKHGLQGESLMQYKAQWNLRHIGMA